MRGAHSLSASNAELGNVTGQIANARSELDGLQQRKAQAQADCAAAESAASDLQAEVDRLSGLQAATQRAVQEQEARAQRLRAQCSSDEERLHAVQLQLRACESGVATAQREAAAQERLEGADQRL
jgi:chromosome segregation ATPase